MTVFQQIIRPDDLCFDIGAHNGVMTGRMLACGAKQVIAVEPQSTCVEYMKTIFSDKPVKIIECAISNKVGKATLMMCNSPQLATLSDRFIKCTSAWRFTTEDWGGTKEVKTDTLQNIIKRYGVPAFCKIDVEGHEPQVLEGLKDPIKVMSFEFTPELVDNAELCLDRLQHLLPTYKFNFSEADTQQFYFPTWVSREELMTYLKTITDYKVFFGDIYANGGIK